MNKLLLTFLFFMAIPIYANILRITSITANKTLVSSEKIVNVGFNVTGEGTQHFQPCISHGSCGYPARATLTQDKTIQFYIKSSHYKNIKWTPSCGNFPVCKRNIKGASDYLCYPYNYYGSVDNVVLSATSKVKNGILYISDCL